MHEAGRLLARVRARLTPDRAVDFYLDRPLAVCLPFRDAEQYKRQLAGVAQLRALEPAFGKARLLLVTDCVAEPGWAREIGACGGSLTIVPDFRSLVSFLGGAQFRVVLPVAASGAADSLESWCDAFHIGYFRSMQDLAQSLRERRPLRISGPFAATHAVHQSLWLSVMGNQYAFSEPLDWDIVRRLPGKFIELRTSAELHAHPMSMLSGPLNRITRQRAVGALYGEYLRGESVVDIGCDVRGIEEFVGPQTRYIGIDMHGRPDMLLNLDREPLPFAANSIETIVCVETLEHLQHIHRVMDQVMSVSRRYVIGSLPVQPAFTRNRLVDELGGPFSFHTPIAPVFDRHQWVGSFSDNLDFVYYRSARQGFVIRRLDLFFMPSRFSGDQRGRVLSSFRRGRLADLNHRVGLMMFVLERGGVECH